MGCKISAASPGLLVRANQFWNDLDAAKRLLLDDIIRERNAYAETIVKDVDQRREEMRATGTGP